MRRTVVVKIKVDSQDEYADAVLALNAIAGVESWRASSMNAYLMRRLRAAGLAARWLPGTLRDAL